VAIKSKEDFGMKNCVLKCEECSKQTDDLNLCEACGKQICLNCGTHATQDTHPNPLGKIDFAASDGSCVIIRSFSLAGKFICNTCWDKN